MYKVKERCCLIGRLLPPVEVWFRLIFFFFSPNNFPFLLIYTNSEGLLIERNGRIKGQFLGLF